MTPDRTDAPMPMTSSPAERSPGTPARRRRFAAALAVFGIWVAFLAVLATRAEPPDPVPGASPDDESPATSRPDAASPRDGAR